MYVILHLIVLILLHSQVYLKNYITIQTYFLEVRSVNIKLPSTNAKSVADATATKQNSFLCHYSPEILRLCFTPQNLWKNKGKLIGLPPPFCNLIILL